MNLLLGIETGSLSSPHSDKFNTLACEYKIIMVCHIQR